MNTRLLGTAALLGFASVSVAQNGNKAEPAQVDLPVTRAVLFSSGVGYFEHAGSVQGDAQLSLRFKTDQINDVLKSMVLMDAGGGTVTSVTYTSNDPIARALRSFGVDLSGDPSLPELLQQLRGARVVVRAPEAVEGSVLTVTERTKVVNEVQVTDFVLNLVTKTGIRTLPLDSIESLEFVDPTLREEMSKALELLVQSRDTERKPVNINFMGQGARQVRVGYVVESPVWKTSYRLDLTGSEQKDGDKPLLQGWAIVENTSDSDWKNVQLSLVSGRPISFVMDLYTPLYAERPEGKPQLMASLKPRVYEEGIERPSQAHFGEADTPPMDAMPAPSAPMARRDMAKSGPGFGMAAQADVAGDTSLRTGAVRSAASAGSVGELFQFTLHHPVDMPRRRSAMLPIVNQDVTAQKVSIYNTQAHATHPLNGVWLTNDTGLKLIGGPVTVYDSGAYAGDAQIDHLGPGDKRLLSYAVDLAVFVDPSINHSDRITAAKIVRGVLEITRLNLFEQTYLIKNKTARGTPARNMVIEHPFVNGRELVDTPAPAEKTPQWYRFATTVEPDTTAKFVVKERQTTGQVIGMFDQAPQALLWVVQNKQISQKVRDAVARAIELKQQEQALAQQINQRQQELSQIKQGQDRLRQNLQTVGQDSQLGKRYLAKLSAEEDQIERLTTQIEELQKALEAKRRELVDYLRNLNVAE